MKLVESSKYNWVLNRRLGFWFNFIVSVARIEKFLLQGLNSSKTLGFKSRD
jgi:hypothetical protein